jgi:F-box domain.
MQLLDLPVELIDLIISFLKLHDLVSCSFTCSLLRGVATSYVKKIKTIAIINKDDYLKIKGKNILNRNVVIRDWHFTSPIFHNEVFSKTKTLFLIDCDKNFVFYSLNTHIFPMLKRLYLGSHPCEYSVFLSFPIKKEKEVKLGEKKEEKDGIEFYLVENHYNHYKDKFNLEEFGVQSIKREKIEELIKQYESVNLISEEIEEEKSFDVE